MRLLRDYIEIEVEQPESKTKSGFHLKEMSKTYQPIGKVIGVGDLVTQVKEGDRVMFLRFAALDDSEKNHKICQEKHIIKIL